MQHAARLSLPCLVGKCLCQRRNGILCGSPLTDPQQDDGCWLDVLLAQILLLVSGEHASEHIMHLHANVTLRLAFLRCNGWRKDAAL